MTKSQNKKKGMAIVTIYDGDSDEIIWDALKGSEEALTAAVVDLRMFPRETIDDLLNRLYKEHSDDAPKDNKRFIPKNQI